MINARLKQVEGELLAQGLLASSNRQMKDLTLSRVCLTDTSVTDLSKFLNQQGSLQKLMLVHVADSLEFKEF